jgi:hypothetical protein
MNQSEYRAVMVPLLKAAALTARLEKRRTIAAEVGWPMPDPSAEVAEGRRLLRQARLELGAAQARVRFQSRHVA